MQRVLPNGSIAAIVMFVRFHDDSGSGMRLGILIGGPIIAVLWTTWMVRAFGLTGISPPGLHAPWIAASLLGCLLYAGIWYGLFGGVSRETAPGVLPEDLTLSTAERARAHASPRERHTASTGRRMVLRVGTLAASLMVLAALAVSGKYLLYWRLASLADLSPAAGERNPLRNFRPPAGESYALVFPTSSGSSDAPESNGCTGGAGAVLSLYEDSWNGDAWREVNRQALACEALPPEPPPALVGAGRLQREGDSLTFLIWSDEHERFAPVGAGRLYGDSLRVQPAVRPKAEYLYLLQGHLEP